LNHPVSWYNNNKKRKFIEHQISMLELFLKDHMELKAAENFTILMFLLYYLRSNKCSLIEHNRLNK